MREVRVERRDRSLSFAALCCTSSRADGVEGDSYRRCRRRSKTALGMRLAIRLEGEAQIRFWLEFDAHRQGGVRIAIPPDAEIRLRAELKIANYTCHVNDGLRVLYDAAFAQF